MATINEIEKFDWNNVYNQSSLNAYVQDSWGDNSVMYSTNNASAAQQPLYNVKVSSNDVTSTSVNYPVRYTLDMAGNVTPVYDNESVIIGTSVTSSSGDPYISIDTSSAARTMREYVEAYNAARLNGFFGNSPLSGSTPPAEIPPPPKVELCEGPDERDIG